MNQFAPQYLDAKLPALPRWTPTYWFQRVVYKWDHSFDIPSSLFLFMMLSLSLALPLLILFGSGLSALAALIISIVVATLMHSMYFVQTTKAHYKILQDVQVYYPEFAKHISALYASDVVDTGILLGSIDELKRLVALEQEISEDMLAYEGISLTAQNTAALERQRLLRIDTRNKIKGVTAILKDLHHERKNLELSQRERERPEIELTNTDRLAQELSAARELGKIHEQTQQELMGQLA